MKKRNKACFVLWQGIALVAILVSLLAVSFGASIVYAGDGNTSGGGASTSGGSVSSGGAAAEGNSFTATIAPTSVTASSTNTFTLVVENVTQPPDNLAIGGVTILVPAGFTGVTNVSAWCDSPANGVWQSGFSIPPTTRFPSFLSPLIWAYAGPTAPTNQGWNECLQINDSAFITFDATAPSAPFSNPYVFYTTAYIADHGKGQIFTLGSSTDAMFGGDSNQPTVTVSGAGGPPPVVAPVVAPVVPLTPTPTPPPPPPPPPVVVQPSLYTYTFDVVPVSTPVLVVDVLGTVARYPVTNDGILLADAMTTSPDGMLTLLIPAGTLVMNPNGSPAYLNKDPDVFSISAATPQPPAGYTMVAAYEFLPSGIIFRPEATLIIKYNAEKMPAGGAPVIAYYDEAAGQWINLETAGYVAGGVEVPNTVQAHTAHLTYFAILATQ